MDYKYETTCIPWHYLYSISHKFQATIFGQINLFSTFFCISTLLFGEKVEHILLALLALGCDLRAVFEMGWSLATNQSRPCMVLVTRSSSGLWLRVAIDVKWSLKWAKVLVLIKQHTKFAWKIILGQLVFVTRRLFVCKKIVVHRLWYLVLHA